MKKLESGYFSSSQSYKYHAIYEYEKFIIQIEISRDSYDFQSSAKCQLLTLDGWTLLYSIPYPEMESVKLKVSYLIPNVCQISFKEDEKRILEMVEILLNNLKDK